MERIMVRSCRSRIGLGSFCVVAYLLLLYCNGIDENQLLEISTTGQSKLSDTAMGLYGGAYNTTSFIFKAQTVVFNCPNLKILSKVKSPSVLSFPPEVNLSSSVRELTEDRRKSFEYIFKAKIWKGQRASENPRSLIGSGRGSTLASTVRARRIISQVITLVKEFLGKERITLLDIPCGDMNWMPLVVANRTDVQYTGVDIVPELIQSHRKFFQKQTHMQFIIADIVTDTLHSSYDLIITREMMQHLMTSDALMTLQKFSDSGSKFLLATTVTSVKENTELDIVKSWPDSTTERSEMQDFRRYRPQNLENYPYNLPRPICVGRDIEQEYLGLWKLPLYIRDNKPQ